jgi:hypothetical protein
MVTLNWIGKHKVINYHQDVPYMLQPFLHILGYCSKFPVTQY